MINLRQGGVLVCYSIRMLAIKGVCFFISDFNPIQSDPYNLYGVGDSGIPF